MPIGGLPTNYAEKAMTAQTSAANTLGQMQKKGPGKPKKTAGGAMQAAAGGAMAGSVVPGWGTAIGAVAGVAMYYMS